MTFNEDAEVRSTGLTAPPVIADCVGTKVGEDGVIVIPERSLEPTGIPAVTELRWRHAAHRGQEA